MAILNDEIQNQVREVLAELDAPVKLVVFTQGEGGALECAMCAETRGIIEEVAALSGKISVEIRDFVADSEVAETYGIDKIPAVAVVREGDSPADYGVRLFGIPSGYEFGTLIEDIRLVSSGNQYKNAPIAGKLMASLIDYCENGNDHDTNPMTFTLPYLGLETDAGFYSRKRPINEESSFSVLG